MAKESKEMIKRELEPQMAADYKGVERSGYGIWRVCLEGFSQIRVYPCSSAVLFFFISLFRLSG
jgi:hypothetical protein